MAKRISAEERAKIEAALRSGRFGVVAETARQLGRSTGPLFRIARQLGITFRAATDQHQDELLERLLRRGGWTHPEIAEAVGCTESLVFGRARSIEGKPATAPPPTDDQTRQVEARLADGELSDVKIALAVDELPPSYVRTIRAAFERRPQRRRTARRNRPSKGEKRSRFGLYSDPTGPTLAVPTLAMWKVRQRAEKGLATRDQIRGVVRPHPHARWLDPWISGQPVPAADAPCYIATEAMVKACRNAWDYVGICDDERVRTSWFSYALGLELFPASSLDRWIIWLYGGPVPGGFFVVPPLVIALKERLTGERIRQAAGLGRTTMKRWKTDAQMRQALADVSESIAKGAGEPKTGAWNRQSVSTRRAMLRYASKATLASAYKDCGVAAGRWGSIKHDAAKAGCKQQLLWLFDGAIKCRNGVLELTASQKHELEQLADPDSRTDVKLFLAPPWMHSFRTVASERANTNKLPNVRRQLPTLNLFHAWMIDWTLPIDDYRSGYKWRDIRQRLLGAAADVPNGPGEPDGPAASTDPPAIAAADPPDGRGSADLTEGTTHERREPPAPYPDPDNEQRDKWLTETRREGWTLPQISAALETEHPTWNQLGSDNGINNAIRRYCLHFGLPIPRGRIGRPRID